jgi:excinuclease ABC subunit B
VPKLRVDAPYEPAGDQPAAITKITEAVASGKRNVCVLGITGSGKSATIAWAAERLQRPMLVLAPNKALAAQLHSELAMLMPENAVEYFVSYYDYYQPEAYVAASDTFIEKESMINDAIDRLRHSATSSALSRRDCIVVASVSAIYGLGAPEEYRAQLLSFVIGETAPRDTVYRKLVSMGYERNDVGFSRGTFRVRGEVLDIWPASGEEIIRVRYFDDDVELLERCDTVTGETLEKLSSIHVYPATHYVASAEMLEAACGTIETELEGRLAELHAAGKLLEAQRLGERTRRDVDLLRETGRCPGIENYSRHFDGRAAGEPPHTLLEYFDDDLIVVLDESHVLIPQISAQQAGDRSRKNTLVEHGFRLPSAADNRPLSSAEFWAKLGTCITVSATPGPYERSVAEETVELIVRPTGIIDPVVEVRPGSGAVADFVAECERKVASGGRVLATVLTKKMAESLVEYLLEQNIRARYMHSDTETLERISLLRDLRLGEYDVLVGINLLREGLDLPEVTFVAVFDADREGFLRSSTSLIQTIGRAARNVEGSVVLYADRMTPAMQLAMGETSRRRELQLAHNLEHGIDPKNVVKQIAELPRIAGEQRQLASTRENDSYELSEAEVESNMLQAAERLEFESAAKWRDMLSRMRRSAAVR